MSAHESPLITLLGLARRVRQVRDPAELGFMAVNDSHALAAYRQAALWFERGGVRALSGVVQVEANVPYVQWLDRACAALLAQGGGQPREVTAASLPEPIGSDWAEWLPGHGLCVPLGEGGIALFARDQPWRDEEVGLLVEWMDAWHHAWNGIAGPRSLPWWRSPAVLLRALRPAPGRPWWRQRAVAWAVGVAVLLLFPVRLSVLAPGELVPSAPAVIRAPFDGVVASFLVKPNEPVRQGQPLLTLDDTSLVSRLQVARQALATAEAELRQVSQQALVDTRYKAQLVVLSGKMQERRAEADYLQGQLERAHVAAPRDGLALFDDPAEWVGKPVVTGERILRVAAPDDVELEAWLPVSDAIPLPSGATATLYLNASPLAPVAATVRYVAHEAVARPDGTYAYRLRAALQGRTDHRVGLKGTARLQGPWVPLIYWTLRRPLAALRQFAGW